MAGRKSSQCSQLSGGPADLVHFSQTASPSGFGNGRTNLAFSVTAGPSLAYIVENIRCGGNDWLGFHAAG